MQLTIVMPIYDGVTHLDFTGPHQFFARLPGASIVVASIDANPVRADGLTFSGLQNLESVGQCDLLCVPGGLGCTAAMEDARYMAAIQQLAAQARYITSVCSGSLILGAAGLLKGRKAACHWAWREMLPMFGAQPDAARVVRDGNIITGGGVTAGIDFALVVIAEIAGRDVAEAIQLALEYAPEPPFGAGRPDSAPPAIFAAVSQRITATMSQRRAIVERAAAALSARGVAAR